MKLTLLNCQGAAGDGTKPVYPLGFSKGNPGLERKEVVNVQGNLNTDKLAELRESVKAVEQVQCITMYILCNYV